MNRPCPQCGADDARRLYACDEDFVDGLVFAGHRRAYSVVRCRRCSLVYVPEPIDEAVLGELYGAEYYRGRDGDGFVDYAAQEAKYRARFGRRLERLEPWIGGGRVLDVGCALGWFLAEASDRGWEAEGVEVSEHAREFVADRFGLTVHTGRLQDAGLAPGAWDLVALWDTIEHLVDPADMLRRCAGLVRPGGYLVLSTGNHNSWRSRIQGRDWPLVRPPKHLTYFTPRTLRSMVARAGLVPVHTWQEPPGRIPAPLRKLATRLSEDAADLFGLLAVKPGRG